MTDNQRKERKRGIWGGGGPEALWTDAVIFHPADFLPPVLGDWVGGEMIVAAVCVDVRGVMSLHCEPTQGWRRENEEGAVREAGGWLLLA